MNLKIFPYESMLKIDEEAISVLVVEDIEHFNDIVWSIKQLIHKVESKERINISEDDNVLDFSKEVILITDMYNMPFDNRNIQNALLKSIEGILNDDEEMKNLLCQNISAAYQVICDIISEYDFDISLSDVISIKDFIKAMNIKVLNDIMNNHFGEMLNFVDVVAEFSLCKLMILVNFKKSYSIERKRSIITRMYTVPRI
ncbi:MAG: type II-A CRISPR-associated protein Csn2 [Vallitaleaceae bacterium]|nr:type II-A CRISPR-associated protein Csn2 [Vallitaleaceae bacterium]